MTRVTPAGTRTGWVPSDRSLLGIVLAVLNFWLFAQTLLNVIPGMASWALNGRWPTLPCR